MHQRADRVVDLGKLIMAKPLHSKRFCPDHGRSGGLASDQELDVEMEGRPDDPARHLVLGEQQRIMVKLEIDETALLRRLTECSLLDRVVDRFQVATGLQPAPDPAVQGEQDLTVSGADQRACRQMRTRARARPAVGMILKMIEVASPQSILVGRGREPPPQRLPAAVEQPAGHSRPDPS